MTVDADDRSSRRCERCRIRVTNVADALVETIELPVDVRVRTYFRLNLEEKEFGMVLPPPERTSVLRIR